MYPNISTDQNCVVRPSLYSWATTVQLHHTQRRLLYSQMATTHSGVYSTVRWPQPSQATIVQSDGHSPGRRLLYSQMATTHSGDYCTVRWPQPSQATIVQSDGHSSVRRLLYSLMTTTQSGDYCTVIWLLLYSQMATAQSGDYCTVRWSQPTQATTVQRRSHYSRMTTAQ